MSCSTKRSIIDRLPLPDALRKWFREWFWFTLLIIAGYAILLFYALLIAKNLSGV